MGRWIWVLAACALLFVAIPAFAKEGPTHRSPDWSAVIPEAFPGHVFMWRLDRNGTYEEDGIDAATGAAIQDTLTGRWRVDGEHMVLAQDTLGFVFVGVVSGDLYTGELYQDGRVVSYFCAARGPNPPARCAPRVGV